MLDTCCLYFWLMSKIPRRINYRREDTFVHNNNGAKMLPRRMVICIFNAVSKRISVWVGKVTLLYDMVQNGRFVWVIFWVGVCTYNDNVCPTNLRY